MTPTPNDTASKQFFTALSMTFLFALGVLASWLLFKFSGWLYTSQAPWIKICGHVVLATAWLNSVIVFLLGALGMIDWMRSTVKHHSAKFIKTPANPSALQLHHHR